MEFRDYLKVLALKDGSDIYLSTGAPPSGKFHGVLEALERRTMEPGEVKKIAYEVMGEEKVREFEQKPEMNLAINEEGIGRFRVNIYK